MKRCEFNRNWKYRNEKDTDWSEIWLPHDAMLSEERTPDSPGESAVGFFTGGVYHYEKHFEIQKDWEGDYIAFEFEGIYSESEIRINGTLAGGSRYGYRNFIVEAAELLHYDADNLIEVKAINDQMPNSRWYTGSGIYRPVHMLHAKRNHINPYGVKIKTLSYDPARIQVSVDCSVANETDPECKIQIFDQDNQLATEDNGITIEMDIPNARLWSGEHPHLYTCRVTLLVDGEVQDIASENFGIRKLEWSTKGFFVNGHKTLLRGACVHHDNGVLGAATYAKSEERRVRILKEQGYNAIRSSHNPASTAMIEACDSYGMYLMDETWDMWYGHKNKHDYASIFLEEYEKDLVSIVERDYNHPSVIMYSLANEVSEPKDEKGVKLLQKMVQMIHDLDDTRPATAGMNLMVIEMASRGKGVYKEEGGRADQDKQSKKPQKQQKSGSIFFNMMTSIIGTNMNKMANSKHADEVTTPGLDTLDIAGYNYASGRYALEGEKHPNRIIFGSETFPQDIWKNWELVKKYPYVLGDFMWTGWDYIGEAGIGAWAYGNAGGFDKEFPWLLADVGAIDITGFAGAESYYAATVWGLRSKPYIGVQPVNHPGVRPLKSTWRGTNAFDSWSYQNCEGNKAVVEVYSDEPQVQLFLNGRGLGKKKIKACKAVYKLKYTPGTLTAVSYDANGTEVARSAIQSGNGAEQIRLKPEEKQTNIGNIVYIPTEICDTKGITESNGDTGVKLTVTGGTLLGFGSANPCTTERFGDGYYHTYYGRALAVVRADQAGMMVVEAKADNGLYARTEIAVTEE